MKTAFDFGHDYAEFMVDSNQVPVGETVNIDEMVTSSQEIPDGDYTEMKRAGIANPNAREYWAGYNAYMEENK